MNGTSNPTARVAALVGPSLSGKTALMEALLHAAGAIPKKGTAKERNTVGDASMEAKARGMGVELGVASFDYQGDNWTLIDCPGSVEFSQEALHGLMVADIAIVVVEADPGRAAAAAPMLQALDGRGIPHAIFIHKVDLPGAGTRLRDTLSALQGFSDRPLVLREVPLKEGENITGFVDLVSETAYGYKNHEDAALAQLPDAVKSEEGDARRELLERLADHDDQLLEELLEEVNPPAEEILNDLRKDLAEDLLVDVFFGSGEQDHGVQRLWQFLKEEAPSVEVTAQRLNLPKGDGFLAQSFKTLHAPHVGKLSFSRVWRGEVSDGQSLGGMRLSGVYRLFGAQQAKQPKAGLGEVVALGHLDAIETGQGISSAGMEELPWVELLQPVAGLSLKATKNGDEVKLSTALGKLAEEDPSLQVELIAESHEQILWGQGEIHLRNALDRLKSRFGLEVKTDAPQVPYRETIRKSVSQHGRFKHQSGGHGAFGDVNVDFSPLPRGSGYVFEETVVGGVIPRQYFSSVEKGIREASKHGPLGFQLVDFKAVLTHGSYHTVDSSDAAFQQAARIAFSEAMPKCSPVLLEPILELQIHAPSEHTPKVQRMISSRRSGQILGFDQREGWRGWDTVSARLPQTEMKDLITELRSLTLGIGTFTWSFHKYQELEGKEAERVIELRKKSLAEARA
jgi:elongation factor G